MPGRISGTALAFGVDGGHVYGGCHDGTLRIWDTDTGDARALMTGHTGAINSLHVSADGAWLISISKDKRSGGGTRNARSISPFPIRSP
jgi:WD40 repeat protein